MDLPVCALATLMAVPVPFADGTPAHGVLVESVAPGLGGAHAGIQPGDLLLGWERPVSGSVPAARGTLATSFELEDLQAEQAPLGPVSLLVDRAGARRSASMPPWPWGLAARPAMDAATLTEYLAAGELISKQDAAGARSLEGLADG